MNTSPKRKRGTLFDTSPIASKSARASRYESTPRVVTLAGASGWCTRRRTPRRGVTLFEVILATLLMVILMGLIGMVVQLHLIQLDSRRMLVEEAQLARAVLRMIADDLKSALRYEEPDLSGIDAFMGGALADGGSGGDPASDIGALLPGLGLGDLGGTGEVDNTQDIAEAESVPLVPGLYGNQYELQVDISRLPRIDQYAFTPAEAVFVSGDIPSDVKTVSYFLSGGANATSGPLGSMAIAPSMAGGPAQMQGGLYRRELDRAMTSYAYETASLGSVAPGSLLAPEVVGVEFRYFDGLEWLTEWDSAVMVGLPLAVEVAVAILPAEAAAEYYGEAVLPEPGAGYLPPEDALIYRMVVALPLGGAAKTAADLAAEEVEGEDAATDGGDADSGAATGGLPAGGLPTGGLPTGGSPTGGGSPGGGIPGGFPGGGGP